MGNGSQYITSTGSYFSQIARLKKCLAQSQAVLIGAGAGLSASAGADYSGARFKEAFADFIKKYGIRDMYSGSFTKFEDEAELWAFWSRVVLMCRYEWNADEVYTALYSLVKEKNYFVLTTNVDHRFQIAGFDKSRLFYTQGDYGLWQCSVPCHNKTYDNERQIRRMAEEQCGMKVPKELLPRCPVCGAPMVENLRSDDKFVQDEGWYAAAQRYKNFLSQNLNGRILYLELGVGGNTPAIIKYPFWQYTARNKNATYACINLGECFVPSELAGRSICIDADIKQALADLQAPQ